MLKKMDQMTDLFLCDNILVAPGTPFVGGSYDEFTNTRNRESDARP